MKNYNSYLRVKILIFALFFYCASYAQNNVNPTTHTINVLADELHGKFQIQMIGIRTNPAISQELLTEIKDKQALSERVYFFYKENIKIMILSKEEISNGEIISDDQFIVYLN